MPVDDHPIHERTIEKPGTKWGCWNSERTTGYWVPTRNDDQWNKPTAWEWVEDRSSKHCVHKTQEPNDPKCEGCLK